MKVRSFTILAALVAVVAIIVTAVAAWQGSGRAEPHGDSRPQAGREETKGPERQDQREVNTAINVSDLALPFSLSDLDEQNGEVNPIGVVRFSKDESHTGHSGIDFPLTQDAPVYAVADGEIVLVKSASDPWGGQGVYQLIQPTATGEGWSFLYEHITPAGGITEGAKVKTGQTIGTKTAPAGFTAHFQLSYSFNDYQYTRDIQCWPDFLSQAARSALDEWWNDYRVTNHLLGSWRTTQEEGAFPFLGLLDETKYPTGPQLCYPLGTDVR